LVILFVVIRLGWVESEVEEWISEKIGIWDTIDTAAYNATP
jgi:hypothetical protein